MAGNLWERFKAFIGYQQTAPPRTAAQRPQPQAPPNPALQPKRSQAPPEAKLDVARTMEAAKQAQAQVKAIGQQFQRSVVKHDIGQAQGQHISNAELGHLPKPVTPKIEKQNYERPARTQARERSGRER